jgi:hypothetical protein
MGKINWGRVLLCGLAAGVVWTVLSIVITTFIATDFVAAVPGGRLNVPSPRLAGFLYMLNILMGIWSIWLYAAIRPRYGAGPKTAAVAGFSWWIIASLVDATWGSFGFVTPKVLLPLVAASLPALILAAMTGAWLYKE